MGEWGTSDVCWHLEAGGTTRLLVPHGLEGKAMETYVSSALLAGKVRVSAGEELFRGGHVLST